MNVAALSERRIPSAVGDRRYSWERGTFAHSLFC